jgi:hypothetical protein
MGTGMPGLPPSSAPGAGPGKRCLRVYRAQVDRGGKIEQSTARRHFRARCGSALWAWDPTWPELVQPHASAIDTPLPKAPRSLHIMLGSCAPWVEPKVRKGDECFAPYPDMSLAQWHEQRGLVASPC